MSFLRHVGKHGDRKVAVIFREVPNEEHMCLVCYPQLLNQNIHDPLIHPHTGGNRSTTNKDNGRTNVDTHQ